MFDFYLLDYYGIDGQHYVRTDDDFSVLLEVATTHLDGYWQIIKGEFIEGLFYPIRIVARSADV